MSREARETRIPLPGLTMMLLAIVAAFFGWMIWQSAETDRLVENQQDEAERRKQALLDPDASLRERIRAIDAWSEEGLSAVPHLLGEIKHSSPAVREAVALALGRIRPWQPQVVEALVGQLQDAEDRVRDAAGGSLCHISETDPSLLASHLPRLASLLDGSDQQMRNDILMVLGRSEIGPDTYVEVLRLTESAQPAARRVAAAVIRRLDRADPESIKALRRLLDDADAAVRGEAFRTLATFGAVTVDESLAALTSEDDSVRSVACVALQSFGSDAAPATDDLRQLLETGWGRDLVLETLGAIGPAAEAAVQDVQELLAGATDAVAASPEAYDAGRQRAIAVRCLARISTDESLVLPILKQDLVGRNRWASGFAGQTLREFYPDRTRELVPELVVALAEADTEQARALLNALGAIGPEAAAAVPALVDLLKAERPRELDGTFESAMQALGQIGPAAADAAPVLAELLQSQLDTSAGLGVLRALYGIGVPSPAAERILIEFIEPNLPLLSQDPGRVALPPHFYLAVLTLGRVGANSKSAYRTISAVQQALEQRPSTSVHASQPPPHWNVRVLWALAEVGVRPDETVDVLLRALDESRSHLPRTRDEIWSERTLAGSGTSTPMIEVIAIRGLGLFPECSARSVPVLTKVLEGDRHAARVAAVLALRNFGEAARAAEPQLRRIAEDPLSQADPVLRSIGRGEPTPRLPVDADPPPDPIWEYQRQLGIVSLGDAARVALERNAGR